MKTTAPKLKKERSPGRVTYVADHPLTLEEFAERFGEDDDVELIDGVGVERVVAHDPHENLFRFLLSLMSLYVETKELGIVRGSRTLVPITAYRGRLPDILFVRSERGHIVAERGLTEAPDLVVEIVSPGETEAEQRAREADYRQIGVKEIWFVDLPGRAVRGARWDEANHRYERIVIEERVLRSTVMEGLWLRVDWLWRERLPSVEEVLLEVGGETYARHLIEHLRQAGFL